MMRQFSIHFRFRFYNFNWPLTKRISHVLSIRMFKESNALLLPSTIAKDNAQVDTPPDALVGSGGNPAE